MAATAPDPRALAESLAGKEVRVKCRGSRRIWVGIMLPPGDQGFGIDLTDGIGGRARFYYREVAVLEAAT